MDTILTLKRNNIRLKRYMFRHIDNTQYITINAMNEVDAWNKFESKYPIRWEEFNLIKYK